MAVAVLADTVVQAQEKVARVVPDEGFGRLRIADNEKYSFCDRGAGVGVYGDEPGYRI